MFLKNFKILQQSLRYFGGLGEFQPLFNVTATTGTIYTINGCRPEAACDPACLPKQLMRSSGNYAQPRLSDFFTKSGRFSNLYVGTSAKAVTESDYTMTIPSALKYAEGGAVYPTIYKDSNDMLHAIYRELYINSDPESEVVLNEYGLVKSVYNTTGSSSINEAPILIFRDLFDEPITVPANGTFTLSVDFIIGPSDPSAT